MRYTAIGRIQDRVLIATYHHYTTGAPASKVCPPVCLPSYHNVRRDRAAPRCLTRLIHARVQYLAVAQKVLNSDKVLSQQSANVPNAVDDASCLMQTDKKYMFIGLTSPKLPCTAAVCVQRPSEAPAIPLNLA